MTVPSNMAFGYIPDVEDQRDWSFDSFMSTQTPQKPQDILSEVDWRMSIPDILDQKRLGACVAHGTLGAIRLKHVLNGVKNPKLGNRLHVYRGAREYIGMGEFDSGSQIRDAFRFINSVGFMPEEDTDNKYDIKKYRELPTPREMRLMFDQRNTQEDNVEYYRITETDEDRKTALKRAMSNQGIPVLGTETTAEFLNYKEGVLDRPAESTRSTGGHAFFLAGYTDEYVIGVNSWDDDWGMGGFMYLSWEYMMWKKTRDIWIVQQAPYFSGMIA